MFVFLQKLYVRKDSFCFVILGREKCFLHQENKMPKSTFFNGVSPWFLVKNQTFSLLSFLPKVCHKRLLFDILIEKNAF